MAPHRSDLEAAHARIGALERELNEERKAREEAERALLGDEDVVEEPGRPVGVLARSSKGMQILECHLRGEYSDEKLAECVTRLRSALHGAAPAGGEDTGLEWSGQTVHERHATVRAIRTGTGAWLRVVVDPQRTSFVGLAAGTTLGVLGGVLAPAGIIVLTGFVGALTGMFVDSLQRKKLESDFRPVLEADLATCRTILDELSQEADHA